MNVGVLNLAYKYLLRADPALAEQVGNKLLLAFSLPVWILLREQEEGQFPGRPGKATGGIGAVGRRRNSPVFPVEEGVKAGSCVSGRQHPGKVNRRRQCPTSSLMFKLL